MTILDSKCIVVTQFDFVWSLYSASDYDNDGHYVDHTLATHLNLASALQHSVTIFQKYNKVYTMRIEIFDNNNDLRLVVTEPTDMALIEAILKCNW